MLVVETIAKIRRGYFVQKKAIKEICRELKVSRKTVRRVVRSGATEFVYQRKVQPQPKIGPWRAELDRLLAANAARASRERLTLIRIFEELRGLGYEGGYDAVRRHAAGWQRERAAATAASFVPLSFAPGETYQFDWSDEVVLIAGVTVMLEMAQGRLPQPYAVRAAGGRQLGGEVHLASHRRLRERGSLAHSAGEYVRFVGGWCPLFAF